MARKFWKKNMAFFLTFVIVASVFAPITSLAINEAIDSENVSYEEVIPEEGRNIEVSDESLEATPIEDLADKQNLQYKISEAIENKNSVIVSEDGLDVGHDIKWVNQTEWNAYITAIAVAQAVYDNQDAIQNDVDNAVSDLQSEIEIFNSVKKDGNEENLDVILTQLQGNANQVGKVHVIVENTTFSDSSFWEGTLVDTWVDIYDDSTMMTAVIDALNTVHATQEGAENNYISSINDLGEFDGGPMSGWMGTLNDWFTNTGFGAITVESGSLEDDDEIRIMYTCEFGEDLGGSWNNNDKSLKSLNLSEGNLTPAFDSSIDTYTLIIPKDTIEVLVTPTATNKNFQVRTSIGTKEYKRTVKVPVSAGTIITVKCGDPSWPGMNDAGNVPAKEYNITVETENVLNVEELEAAKEEAASKKQDDYSEESYQVLTAALSLPETTQEEIDAKVVAINDAIAGLAIKTVAVGENEGLKELLIYTGTTASNMQSTAYFGTPNDSYPNRPVFNQKRTSYILDELDSRLNESMRFAVVPAEEGSKVTVYYGENLLEKKLLTNNTSLNQHVGTNWVKSLTRAGKNTFNIVVTPPEGSVNKEVIYTFNVYLSPTISGLSLKDGAKSLYLDKTFNPIIYDYKTTLSSDINTLDVLVTPKMESYKVTYNGNDAKTIDISKSDKIEIEISVGEAEEKRSTLYTVQLNKVGTYDVKFDISPKDSNLVLYDKNGARIKQIEDRCFKGLLPGMEYTYVATKYGYVAQKGVIAGPDNLVNGEIIINLLEAPSPATPLPSYDGDWINFRGNPENMGITKAKTPITTEDAYEKWAVKLGSGWSAAPTPPIIVNNNLYVASANKVYKLNKENGEILETSSAMVGNVGYALNPITYAEGMIFVPVGNGQIQALRADNLESLWVSEVVKGQTLTPITYHNGYIYSGTWNSETAEGTYYGISVTDEDPSSNNEIKLNSWKLNHTGGFYWSGAYATDNYVIFGSDDGSPSDQYKDTAVLYSVNPKTGEIIDTINDIKGDIRSTISFDKESNSIYFSTKGGRFYKLEVNVDGTFNQNTLKSLELGGMATGTPLVFNGRAYLGVAGASQFGTQGHSYKVIDSNTMVEIYSAEVPGYVQTSALLSSHYYDKTGKVYVYTTYNNQPGGIHMIEDSLGQTQAKTVSLFTPVNKQYCISSLVSDGDGTIYYKNDSGYLMAVAKNKVEENLTVKEQLNKNLDFLVKTVDNPTFGTNGGEWSILSLSRGEYQVPEEYYDIYYKNIEKEVKRLMPAAGSKPEGRLDRNKGTEHSRLILGLTSIGKDITDVAGYDIRKALADFTYVTKQGINGPIFALIALDSHNYEILVDETVTNQTTREKMIDYILDKEIGGGGWALSGTTPDPDITSMAIQGLTPYYQSNPKVKSAIDRAIQWLSNAQQNDGGFSSWGSANSESCAQVIVALSGLGIDPHKDERFIKNGNSAVDNLMSFAVPTGGFMHVKSGGNTGGGAQAGIVDGMATDQGTYALVAYDRFVDAKKHLYDMTDVVIQKQGEKPVVITLPEPDENNVIKLPIESDNYNKIIHIPSDNKNIKIIVDIEQGNKAVTMLKLLKDIEIPRIEVNKGGTSILIPKGTKVISGDPSAIELITENNTDSYIRNMLDEAISDNKKTDDILHVFTMGGNDKIEFSDYITLTFKGEKNKEVAYIQNGKLHLIEKFSNDVEGLNSGKNDYAYDNGDDLIVKTNHFTEFVVFTTKKADEQPGGIIPTQPKKKITLSIDKFTINKGYVLPPTEVEFTQGESAWDVLKREMDKRGIAYTYVWTQKYNSVYIEWIAGDGEFDHGSGSGWMYNVNGWYPNYGASVYSLKDGDVMQWRYTTNLGADLGEDLSKWGPLPGEIISVGGSVALKVVSGTGAVSITQQQIEDIINATKKIGLSNVVVKLDTSQDIKNISLELPKKALSSIASEKDLGLEFESQIGTIIIPNSAISYIVKNAMGETVTIKFSLVDKKNLDEKQKEVVGEKLAYVASIESSSKTIDSFDGAEISISIPYKVKEELAKDIKVWHLNDAVELEEMAYKYDAKNTIITFKTKHLSYFVLGVEAPKTIEEAIAADNFTMNFTDVKEGDWYYDAINFVVKNGIFAGTSSNTFSPNQPMTRAMLVTVLHNLEGRPIVGNVSFSDVSSGAWYEESLAWAYKNKLVSGYSKDLFGPNDEITREQISIIIYNYAKYKGYDVSVKSNLTVYEDMKEISPWAVDAISWANSESLINGRTDKLIAPKEKATRAEVATILKNFID
ncbi:S-layer homology domain-containing protein [Acetoanaerobium noterae]|uniref:S-layer homology domain-containing protein n=1 Tax=Acetoanaerobium noterae TaxID=745369 RepID=UPI003334A460